MGIAGVFFDLYGTLLVSADPDSDWEAWSYGFESSLKRHGMRLPASDRRSLSEEFLARPKPQMIANGFTLYEQRVQDFLFEAGLTAPVEVVRDVARASAEAWHEGYLPDPEASAVLSHLRVSGYRLALVSNFDHPPLLRERLTTCGLAREFDVIVVSAEIGASKPDPAAFRPALRETGLSPEQVLHLGDSLDDVLGAKAAGIRPVHLCRVGTPDLSVAEEVQRIACLSDLLALLDEVPRS